MSKIIFTGLISVTPTLSGVALAATDFLSSSSVNETSSNGQHLLYNNTSGKLYYDADGAGEAAAVQIALIGVESHPAVSSGDFLVVI